MPDEPGVLGPAPTDTDLAAVAAQLGRVPRDVDSVAHRCPCGQPDVLATRPRLSDGTPFPTLYYLTCPRLAAAIGRLEASGEMARMTHRLAGDPELAAAHGGAHTDYLRRREVIEVVPEIAGVSAGGMPKRVKCLHSLAAHALAVGPGTNPLGDETLAAVTPWWAATSCAASSTSEPDDRTGSEPNYR